MFKNIINIYINIIIFINKHLTNKNVFICIFIKKQG